MDMAVEASVRIIHQSFVVHGHAVHQLLAAALTWRLLGVRAGNSLGRGLPSFAEL
jgi:hypothetical protein